MEQLSNGHEFALIYRFVPTETEPRLPAGTICTYDPAHNIVRIDTERFNQLSPAQQSVILRSRGTVTMERAR